MTGGNGHPVLDEEVAEQLLTGRDGSAEPDLRRAVALLAAVGDGPPPGPSPALADLLEHGFEPTVVPLRSPALPGRRWAARAGAGLAAAAASVLVAGTAAALPPPLQNTVADLVSALTPFELPRPPEADGPAPLSPDDGSGSATPTPSAAPSPSVGTGAPPARSTDSSAQVQREDVAVDDRSAAERRERDAQRAAQEAAEESQRAAEEAADEAEDAAEEAAEQSQRAAEEAADQAADQAEDAARAQEDAADDAADEAEDAEDD